MCHSENKVGLRQFWLDYIYSQERDRVTLGAPDDILSQKTLTTCKVVSYKILKFGCVIPDSLQGIGRTEDVGISMFTQLNDEIYFFLLNCMLYQLLCVPHSSSSTQSWGSVLPSIVEMRDQNSLLFLNRNLGSFCA